MDSQLLRELYNTLFKSAPQRRRPRCQYSDNVVVFFLMIAALQNVSVRHAYNRKNWPIWLRRLIPNISYSQVMRRLDTPSVKDTFDQLNRQIRAKLSATAEKVVDGKPLPVGAYSKDPEAKRGYLGPRQYARGYKLHAIVDAAGAIEAFWVTPLNVDEARVAAQHLVPAARLDQALLRADANYDSNSLYEKVAAGGGRLIAPRRRPGTGLGHGRRWHPHRLQAIAELEGRPQARRNHVRHRTRVEQTFGQLTNVSFGLFALPNSVRRLHRVRRWIAAKIAIYHLYLTIKQKQLHAA